MLSKRGRIAGLAFLLALPLAAVEDKAPVQIVRASSAVRVDGVLDEAAWSAAAVIDLPVETRPAENQPAPVKTECLVTYDDDRLYVAFRAHDPDPSQIRAHLSDRDNAFDDDFIGIVLDTFNDERRAFEFFVNPLGIQMDLFNDGVSGNEDASWDALWWTAGKINQDGFVVEMAIPFSSLRFPRTQGEQVWGFDALRFYPRDQRHRIASQPYDRNVSCYICQISKMTGFAGITPGRNIELDPTVTAVRTDVREGFPDTPLAEGDVESDLGLTGKWGITPNLTLNAAINPDFSQVEADAAQLDINTTFALFFPEKRPFFLEGADFFSTPFSAVFTRNVADPAWGVKLSGKEGKNAMGVFVAQDDRTDLLIPGSESSQAVSLDAVSTDAVLRYRRDLGAHSALGLLVTSRDGDDYSNHLAGLDGLYRLGDSNSFRAQYLSSQTEYPAALGSGRSLDDHAFHLRYDYNNRNWRGYVQYEDVGDLFRADMGFMPQVDYTWELVGLERSWYPKSDRWTQVTLGSDWEERKDQAGHLLERELEAWLNINGPRQSYLSLDGGTRDRGFRGVQFDETFLNLYGEIQPTGSLYLSLSGKLGDRADLANVRPGKIRQIEPAIRYLPGRHVRIRLSHLLQQLDVKGGQLFEANLSQLTLIYQFNPRTFVRLITQYTDIQRDPGLYTFPVDEKTEELFNQLLFSYKLNPQTVLFAGYTDNSFGDERIDLTRNDRTFFLKVGYAWVP
ncbi:MAG TPA: DUF5916 domain-containing protein [Thermoanaerobaculia bacterium]|jgi:hypothetical protein|nr:DUF5916 domain-containing protein [Thermoanaerobaculia bacterium]